MTNNPQPVVICAWCPPGVPVKVLRAGNPDHGISHGICRTCELAALAELETPAPASLVDPGAVIR